MCPAWKTKLKCNFGNVKLIDNALNFIVRKNRKFVIVRKIFMEKSFKVISVRKSFSESIFFFFFDRYLFNHDVKSVWRNNDW